MGSAGITDTRSIDDTLRHGDDRVGPTERAGPTEDVVVIVDTDGGEVALMEPRRPVVAAITVIADDGWWAHQLVTDLGDDGFEATLDAAGASAFDRRCRSADAAIVDLGLTARSATAVCVAWRLRSAAPILAVSGSRDEAAVLAAFDAGADVVVRRDVTPRQLVAHLRSLLRRTPRRRTRTTEPAGADVPVRLGDDGRSAVVHGQVVPLTEHEFQMLELLLGRVGRVVTKSELADIVTYASGSARAVDFYIRRLRERLEEVDDRRRITAVRGVGFRFDVDTEGAP